MKTKEEILNEVFEPTSFDCSTETQDLQLAITLNPDLAKILQCMQSYASEQCQKRDEIIKKTESLIAEINFAKKHKGIYYAIQGCFDKIDSLLEEIKQLKSKLQ